MERFIYIKGAYNVRDIGGYSTRDGGKIKWGTIFRSGKISHIKDSENEKMASMNLNSICDFRTMAEQEASPDVWLNLKEINQYPFPVGEGRLDKLDWMKNAAKGTGKDSHLYKANRSYVLKNAHRYRAFFEILLDERNYPLLYHCTAGKDRTGFATLLLLSALGVERKTIIEDYLLTNDYLDKFFWKEMDKVAARTGLDVEKVKPILIASEVYLQGAYDAIEENFGTVNNFLQKEIGIGDKEIQQLKDILVSVD